MMNKIFLVLIFIAILGTFSLLTTSPVFSENFTNIMPMMGFKNNSKTESIDKHFIEQMIPHHEDAITMANIAIEKSQKAEIRQLAENIKRTQSEEINQMKSWYKDWFNSEVSKNNETMGMHGMMNDRGMHMGMMGSDQDIEALRNAQDFDKAFIKEMILHHQMAVMMANMLKNSTDKEEMKKLANNIIDAQSSEITKMRQWYQDWY